MAKALQVSLPGAGKTTSYSLTADTPVKFDFDLSEAVFTGTDGNLEIAIEGGGTVILEGYQALADAENLPTFIMMDGEQVEGDVYLFAFADVDETAEDLETAADGAAGGSGAGEYSDDPGSLGDGLDALGGQGDAYATRTLTALENQDGNQPPVAVDDFNEIDEQGDPDFVFDPNNEGSHFWTSDRVNVRARNFEEADGMSVSEGEEGSMQMDFELAQTRVVLRLSEINSKNIEFASEARRGDGDGDGEGRDMFYGTIVRALDEDGNVIGEFQVEGNRLVIDMGDTDGELIHGLEIFSPFYEGVMVRSVSYATPPEGLPEGAVYFPVDDRADEGFFLAYPEKEENPVELNFVEGNVLANDWDIDNIDYPETGGYPEGTTSLSVISADFLGQPTVGTNPDSTLISGADEPPASMPIDGSNATIQGKYGYLEISSDGEYEYHLDPRFADHLDEGDFVQEIFSYTITDPGGLTDSALLTVTIAGHNDRPSAVLDTDFGIEKGNSKSFQLHDDLKGGQTVEVSEGNNLISFGEEGFGEHLTYLSDTQDEIWQLNLENLGVFENGFNFYNAENGGENYTTLSISTNGMVFFGDRPAIYGIYDYNESDLSNESAFIAAHYDDNNNSTSGDVYYHVDEENGTITITWDNTAACGCIGGEEGSIGTTENVNSYQIILHDLGNGDFGVEIRYESMEWSQHDGMGGWSAGDGVNHDVALFGAEEIVGAAGTSNIDHPGVYGWIVRGGEVQDSFTGEARFEHDLSDPHNYRQPVFAEGNVLANDTDVDDNDMVHEPDQPTELQVVGIYANNTYKVDYTTDEDGFFVVKGEYGTLRISPDGEYQYRPTADELNYDDAVNDVFTYAILDNELAAVFDPADANTDVAFDYNNLVITVYGANDRPVASSDSNQIVEFGEWHLQEDLSMEAVSKISGDVIKGDGSGGNADSDVDDDIDNDGIRIHTIETKFEGESNSIETDPDYDHTFASSWEQGDGTQQSVTIDGQYGTLTINSDGTYDYVLDNDHPMVQALNVIDGVPQTLTETFEYTTTNHWDDGVSSRPAQLTITINGSNDAPELTNDTPTTTITEATIDDFTGAAGLAEFEANGMTFTALTDGEVSELDTVNIGLGSWLGVDHGFDLPPIGDHLGDDAVRIDFDLPQDSVQIELALFNSGIPIIGDLPLPLGTGPDFALATMYSATGEVIGTVSLPGTDGGNTFYLNAAPGGARIDHVIIEAVDEPGFDLNISDFFINSVTATVPDASGTDVHAVEEGSTNEHPMDDGILPTEEVSVAGNVLENDTDIDNIDHGDNSDQPIQLSVIGIGAGSDQPVGLGDDGAHELQGKFGTLYIQSDGSYIYTPDPEKTDFLNTDETVTDTFTYVVTDDWESGNAGPESMDATRTATLTISIDGTNDAPIALDDTPEVQPAESATLWRGEHDEYLSDEEGGFNGDEQYTEGGLNASGNVLTNDDDVDNVDHSVEPNEGPDHYDDVDTGAVELTVVDIESITVPGNDATDNSGSFTIDGKYGTLTIHANGDYSYDVDQTREATQKLDTDEDGLEEFTYTISDPGGLHASAKLSFLIDGANDAPKAINDSFESYIPEPIVYSVESFNPETWAAEGIQLGITDSPRGAQLVAHDGGIGIESDVWTPFGTIQDDNDIDGYRDETMTIHFAEGHDTVTITLGNFQEPEDSPIFGGNYTDYELTNNYDGTATVVFTGSGITDLTINANNNLAPHPTSGDEDFNLLSIEVPAPPQPFLEDHSLTLDVADLLVNDLDVDDTNAELSVSRLLDPADGEPYEQIGGTATYNEADGTITFVPEENFNGEASFWYIATDGTDESNPAKVTLTIQNVNDVPVAESISVSVTEPDGVTAEIPAAEEEFVSGNIIEAAVTDADNQDNNPTDPDNPALPDDQLTLVSIAFGDGPAVDFTGTAPLVFDTDYGTAKFWSDGRYEFTADEDRQIEGFDPELDFHYVVRDEAGATASNTVTITVEGLNDAPTAANDDFGTVYEDTPPGIITVGNVGTNDVDIDELYDDEATPAQGPDVLTFSLVTDPADLPDSFELLANGDVKIDTALYDYLGKGETETITFEYTATDPHNATSTATATFIIEGTNDAPVLDLSAGTLNFVYEGAGYNNMLGVYQFVDGKPVDPQIIMENVNDSDPSTDVLDQWNNGDVITTYGDGVDLHYFLVDVGYGETPTGTPEFVWDNATGQWAISFDGGEPINVRFDNDFPNANLNAGDPEETFGNTDAFDAEVEIDDQFETDLDGNGNPLGQKSGSNPNGDDDDYDDIVADENDGAPGYNAGPVTFTEGLGDATGEAVQIAPHVDISDIDSDNISQIKFTMDFYEGDALSGHPDLEAEYEYAPGADPLVDDPISTTYTLTGNWSKLEAEGIIEDISFVNTSQAPDTDQREIEVQVWDDATPGAASNTAIAYVNVVGTNDRPDAVNDGSETAPISMDEDTSKFINVLANDSDIDGDAIFIDGTYPQDVFASDGVTKIGSVDLGVDPADGVTPGLVFTPVADYNGPAVFDYTISDGALTDTATVTIDVIDTPDNNLPVAVHDGYHEITITPPVAGIPGTPETPVELTNFSVVGNQVVDTASGITISVHSDYGQLVPLGTDGDKLGMNTTFRHKDWKYGSKHTHTDNDNQIDGDNAHGIDESLVIAIDGGADYVKVEFDDLTYNDDMQYWIVYEDGTGSGYWRSNDIGADDWWGNDDGKYEQTFHAKYDYYGNLVSQVEYVYIKAPGWNDDFTITKVSLPPTPGTPGTPGKDEVVDTTADAAGIVTAIATGNVLANDYDQDNAGGNPNQDDLDVASITGSGTEPSYTEGNWYVVDGQYGTLRIDLDTGDYQYTPDKGITESGTDVFEYTVTDGHPIAGSEGDPALATAKLEFSLNVETPLTNVTASDAPVFMGTDGDDIIFATDTDLINIDQGGSDTLVIDPEYLSDGGDRIINVQGFDSNDVLDLGNMVGRSVTITEGEDNELNILFSDIDLSDGDDSFTVVLNGVMASADLNEVVTVDIDTQDLNAIIQNIILSGDPDGSNSLA